MPSVIVSLIVLGVVILLVVHVHVCSLPEICEPAYVFKLQVLTPENLPDDYGKSYLERKRRAVLAMVDELRGEPLLPLDPGSGREFVDLDSGVLLPSWHCPFKGCSACGVVRHDRHEAMSGSECVLSENNHAAELWSHVWSCLRVAICPSGLFLQMWDHVCLLTVHKSLATSESNFKESLRFPSPNRWPSNL